MLAPGIRFEGFTTEDWSRVLELFRPLRPRDQPRATDRPQGLVIAVHHGGRLRKLLHGTAGRLRLDELAGDWPMPAAELAQRCHASWVVYLESGALEAVMDGFGARARREDDLTQQVLTLVALLREQMALGRIEVWPDRLAGMPIPTAGMVERSLDMVCPPGRSMLLGLFDRGELYTSIAISRSHEGIDRIVGPEALRPELGLLSGDMRRDHRHLARVAAEEVGPLSLGCFAEHATFRALEVDPTPGAWALAVAVRDVVLFPAPAAMALPLGLDVGRAAFSAMRSVTEHLDPGGVFSPALSMLREVALGGRTVQDLLGFNPLELLRKLLSRDG